jgi:hypothetical protein
MYKINFYGFVLLFLHNEIMLCAKCTSEKNKFLIKVRAPYKNKYTQQQKSTNNTYYMKASRDSDNEVG